MPETVRFVSDGEELVLSEGETARIQPEPRRQAEGERRAASPAPRPIAIQYAGFQDAHERREYRFDARLGEQSRRYTVCIELAAFSRRQALLQDGPDICYQKLTRDVAGAELQGDDRLEVTDAELAAYREAHTVPGRKRFSLPTPAPAKPADGVAFPIKDDRIA